MEHDPVKHGFVMCRDNFIQAKYFQEMDGSDNVFCSQDCACKYLSVERVYQTEDGGFEYMLDCWRYMTKHCSENKQRLEYR